MGIVVSGAFALSQLTAENADYPIAGYDNLATVDTLTTSVEDADYPATNLANPATNLVWKSGSTADQYITILFGAEAEVDYIAIARHNFGSGQVQVTVQGLPFGGNPATDGDWDELVEANLLANDRPALWRFVPTPLIGVRLKLEPGSVEPQAAVLYVGKLLVFERGVQPGHVPIPYARQVTTISPLSQSGEYLGAITSGGKLGSSVTISKLSADWSRSTLEPLLAVIKGLPLFFGWSPERYPTEIGYVWVTNDPQPVPDLPGYVDVTFQFEGLLL